VFETWLPPRRVVREDEPTRQNGTCVPRNSGRFSYIVRSLGLIPERFISRLARSTYCQRPNRVPPERCVSVDSPDFQKKPVSSKLAASLGLIGVKRRTLQTYRELLIYVNRALSEYACSAPLARKVILVKILIWGPARWKSRLETCFTLNPSENLVSSDRLWIYVPGARMQPEERFLVASISDDRGTVVDSKNLTSTRLLFPATS